MILKLRNRLTRLILVFIAVILLLAFAAIFTVTAVRVQSENSGKITAAETVEISSGGQVTLDGRSVTDAVVIKRISPELGVYFNLITDAGGQLAVDSALDLEPGVYDAAKRIALENPGGGFTKLAGRTWQYLSSPATTRFEGQEAPLGDSQTLHRFLDITDSVRFIRTQAVTLSCLYVVLMLIFFFTARYFADRSVRPMAEAWEKQRQFIADASHELKTPISTLSANLDVLYASREEPVQSQIRWLDNSKKVLNRMTMLVRDMLELMQVEARDEKPVWEEVDVGELLEEMLDLFQPAAHAKSIEILENEEKGLFVWSNRVLLQQVLEILMDNAVRYTDTKGEIRVDAFRDKGGLIIRILNTGPGIAPGDMDKIFDRFYRGDKARVYSDGNYGLGLSIARSAAEKLGVGLFAESDSRRTAFTLTVPGKKTPRQ